MSLGTVGPSWVAALSLFGVGGLQSPGVVVCLAKQLMSGRSRASRVETGADCRLFPAVGSIAFVRLRALLMIWGICCLAIVIGWFVV